MLLTWDDQKAESNLKKHGVSFEEAVTVFSDPYLQSTLDYYPNEERWITIGQSYRRRILLIVHTMKDKDGVHIISARLLTRKEQRDYEEGI